MKGSLQRRALMMLLVERQASDQSSLKPVSLDLGPLSGSSSISKTVVVVLEATRWVATLTMLHDQVLSSNCLLRWAKLMSVMGENWVEP
jgi:hypothetical protein